MGITIKELVRFLDTKDYKLVAGEKGLNAQVSWVHMVGTTEIAQFLTGGEVVFTTGAGLTGQMTIDDLVKSVEQRNASAIIINVGPYISEIPQTVIAYGNSRNFPVIEVPWEVHMADIMRLFSEKILRDEQREMELSSAFKTAMTNPLQEDMYLPHLMKMGYALDGAYCVCKLQLSESVKNDKGQMLYYAAEEERVESFLKYIEHHIKAYKKSAVAYENSQEIIVVIPDASLEEALGVLREIIDGFQVFLQNRECILSGIGKQAKGIRKLFESKKTADNVLRLAKVRGDENKIVMYQDLGIYRLLFEVNEKELLEEFYGETILPLKEYDRLNGSDLVQVLSSYMRNNGSVIATAEEFFVHRNTINYKLHKIESLLQIELTDFQVRNQLAVGLMIDEILGLA